jgi:hypothetical protein
MSYGLLGAMKGLGEGMSQYGEARMKDGFEAAREKRLEEAKKRTEERARIEHDRQQDDAFRRTHGAEADPNVGTANLDVERTFRSQYGAEADPNMGAQHYSDESAVERARREAEMKNEVNAYSGLMTDPTIGTYQKGSDGKIHSIGAGAGGVGKDGATGPGGITEPQMQAIYKLERDNMREGINPSGDFASNAMIQRYGGWEGWSNRYAEIMGSNPGYLEWREMVFGIPNPDTREAPAAQGLPPAEPASVEEPTTELERGRSAIGRISDKIFGSNSPQSDGQPALGAQGTTTNPYRVSSREDVEKLPSGAFFMGRDGVLRSKP